MGDGYGISTGRVATCRLCHEFDGHNGSKGTMFKYAARHYVHAECGLKRWGAKFFDKLHPWQIRSFPALIASRLGFFDELGRRCDALPKEPDRDNIAL